MKSILFYDEHCGWSPSLNASKGTGGAEMHLVGIAEYLASWHKVHVTCHDAHNTVEGGVNYGFDPRVAQPAGPKNILILVRASGFPKHIDMIRPDRVLSIQVDDPRPHPDKYEHLKGRATLVCISEWHAGLFRALGHTDVRVIPSHIPDRYYGMHTGIASKYEPHFCCLSAWNKGTEATLAAWKEIQPRISEQRHSFRVGTPYGAPSNAAKLCEEAGATWLGELKPADWLAIMRTSDAHIRVCEIGETFGVTDAIARAMGLRVNVLCTGDVGALDETGAGPYTDRDAWMDDIVHARDSNHIIRDYRASKILPMWKQLLEE